MAVYTAEQLKCLQEIEIDILKEIERVCDVLDIQYFANYGTLLGAVRHKGFIPWDDDIDICMLRKDYDRFILEAPKVLKKGYTLQHFLVDPNTPTYHAKVRKDGTRFAEDYIENMPIHQGIFVDVFPYDKTADDEECRKKHMKKARLARHLFISKSVSQATNEKNEKKRRLANIIRKGIHSLLIPVPKKCLYNLVIKQCKSIIKKKPSMYIVAPRMCRTMRIFSQLLNCNLETRQSVHRIIGIRFCGMNLEIICSFPRKMRDILIALKC